MPVHLEVNESSILIRMEGDINITGAAELKKHLLEALAPGKRLLADLERSTELDVAALQLLWAARREALRTGVGFTLTGCVPEDLSIALQDAGFEEPADPVNPS